MGEWCALTDSIVAKTGISGQERAERGHRAAEKTLDKERKNKRHSIAIGFAGWGLGLSQGNDLVRRLASLAQVAAGCNEIKHLKAYLPIDAYFLDPQTNIRKSYLKIVVDNLPRPIKQLSLDQQIRFVCMALALIHQESKFNPSLQSQKGAKGAMQLMAVTIEEMRKLYGPLLGRIANIWHPSTNIKIGLTFLCHLMLGSAKGPAGRVYDENRMKFAFIAYNRGENGAKGLTTTAYQIEVEDKYQLYFKIYAQQIRAALLPGWLDEANKPRYAIR